MKNKRGITNLEVVLAVVIFLSGIVTVVLIINTRFTETNIQETQLDKLEKDFKSSTKHAGAVYFYSDKDIESCYQDVLYQYQETSSQYLVYILEENFEEMISLCDSLEYTFPVKAEIYDYEKINLDYAGDFNITIREGTQIITLGKTPPINVPINAREIQMSFFKENEIKNLNVLLRAW